MTDNVVFEFTMLISLKFEFFALEFEVIILLHFYLSEVNWVLALIFYMCDRLSLCCYSFLAHDLFFVCT